MSETLLQRFLSNEIEFEILKLWMCNKAVNIDVDCTPQDFTAYFLSYLRNESSRFVHCTTLPVTSTESSTNPNKVVPKETKQTTISNNGSFQNRSYESNTSLHTSTPKKKFNKSFSSFDTSFTDSHNHVFKSNRNNSLDQKHHLTLENFLPEVILSHSKENILNQKKKKKRRSQSPNSRNNSINCSKNITADSSNLFQTPEILDRSKRKSVENLNNKSRRIKPTILSEKSPKTTIVGSNSFSFTQSNSEVVEDASTSYRSILRKEMEKIAARSPDVIVTVPKYTSSKSFITAQMIHVTQVVQLDSLIKLYSLLLDNNLVLNLVSELHFLFTLLLCNAEPDVLNIDDTVNGQNILSSIHNCVYFASKVLETQASVLCMLKRSTLKLLCENKRLSEFTPKLIKFLTVSYNQKIDTIAEIISFTADQMTYSSETDTKDNFSNVISFQMFRKQRDTFYDILRTWEINHNRPDWNFGTSLGSKIRLLLNIHQDPSNYYHLARLFKNQLLNSGAKNNSDDDLEKDVNLLDVSSDKLNKLKNRLMTKESTQNHLDFPSHQEFYKEFIVSSQNNIVFIKHLENILANGIITLEDNFYSEQSDAEYTFDSGTKNNYISFLKSTKLLAKFLGYIEALPYKTDIPPKGNIFKSLISVRQQVLPILDVVNRLKNNLKDGNALFAIPWIVEYLGQLDYVSLQLPTHENVIRLLYGIYSSAELKDCTKMGLVIIRMCLGELFESANFPRHLLNTGKTEKSCLNFTVTDKFANVSEEILYLCVPRLIGFRTLLATGTTPTCMRYIRPVTAANNDVHLQNQKEQKQLEDVFFHGHPESMKRLVDFVAERVTSVTVKIIKKTHLQESIKVSVEHFQNYIQERQLKDPKNYEKFLQSAIQQAKTIAEKEMILMKKNCGKDIKKIASDRCNKSIPALLPDDVHPSIVLNCVSIAARKATERATLWLQQTLNITEFMDPLTKKLNKIEEDGKNKEKNHVVHYLTVNEHSVVKLLTENKELMFMAHETPELLTSESVITAIDFTKETLRKRKDLGASLRDAVFVQVIDLAVMLIVSKPDLINEVMIQLISCLELFFIKDRRNKSSKETTINIVNPRNILLLSESPDSSKSWNAFKMFVRKLLKFKLLSPSAFEEQVLKLFQKNFPDHIFNVLVINIKEIIDDYAKEGGDYEMIKAASCLSAYLLGELD